jgi:flagellar basal-body rod modification protein FlgD
MATDAISSYLTSYSANASSGVNASSSDSNKNTLDMDDFIQLMVAQLQNQDMNNTTDTSEMMAQMAQYSMVEALNEMKDQSVAASSFTMIGKGVTISGTDDDGKSYSTVGVVDGVSLKGGEAKVAVNGKSYPVGDVKEVFDASLLKDSKSE